MVKVKVGSFNPLPIVPIVLVGANVNGKPNYMAVALVGGVYSNPAVVIICLSNNYTEKDIIENGTFSINIPSADQVIETNYCGIVSRFTQTTWLPPIFYDI